MVTPQFAIQLAGGCRQRTNGRRRHCGRGGYNGAGKIRGRSVISESWWCAGTHHSSNDVYDHLMLDDLKQAAIVVAATAYEVANRDEMFPRK